MATEKRRRPVIGASGSGGPALLYVDALSFLGDFLGAGGSKFGMHGRPAQEDRWRDVLQARVNVRTFMREAQAAGWRVAVFFDMVKQDPHEIDKWWKRKVASAMAGGSNVMPFVTVMLGTLFEAEGATVHYAAEFDNDPTLAAYANIDNAAVLSRDGDFLRYYGTRPTGERFFLPRLYSGFSVGDERNGGKLALWEKRFPTQDRQKAGWELITGVGECKGGLERFLSVKPTTTPHFALLPRRGQRDELGRPHVRISMQSTYPFAFPGEHVSFDRLLLPLRLAVYEELQEPQVVETCLEWVEFCDGFLPDKASFFCKFWGAAWEREKVGQQEEGGREEGGEEGSEPLDWEAVADESALDSAAAVTEAEVDLTRLLVRELGMLRASTDGRFGKADRNGLLGSVARIYELVFGPVAASLPRHVLQSANEVPACTPTTRDCKHGGGTCRGQLPATVWDTGGLPVVDDGVLHDREPGGEGRASDRCDPPQMEARSEACKKEAASASGDSGAQDGRTPIHVTFSHCRNEIVHRFMAVLALAGAVTVSSLGSPPTAPVYESAFWLLESFLQRYGLIGEEK